MKSLNTPILIVGLLLISYSCNSRNPVLEVSTVPTAVPGPSIPNPASTIFSLGFSPGAVKGGGASFGTAILSLPAPPGGLVVTLSSADGAVAVPPSITVPAGTDRVNFTASTRDVPDDRHVLVSASVADRAVSGPLDVWATTLPIFFSFVSDPDDFIGAGGFRRYRPENAIIGAYCSGSSVEISINAGSEHWGASFGAPRGQPMRVGTYEGATRTAFRPEGRPGIDIGGSGRGCNQTVGSFVVHEAEFTPGGGVVKFSATFEQRCDSRSGWLRGDVRVANTSGRPFDSCVVR